MLAASKGSSVKSRVARAMQVGHRVSYSGWEGRHDPMHHVSSAWVAHICAEFQGSCPAM
jgi:hypothetical protein